mmetsp:Transcript_7908/g.28836  ORF Transcript_7908/g.28836 Transcript_7908/m.28836 type:complete len:298 (+) Transcript_7908:57-950(+)
MWGAGEHTTAADQRRHSAVEGGMLQTSPVAADASAAAGASVFGGGCGVQSPSETVADGANETETCEWTVSSSSSSSSSLPGPSVPLAAPERLHWRAAPHGRTSSKPPRPSRTLSGETCLLKAGKPPSSKSMAKAVLTMRCSSLSSKQFKSESFPVRLCWFKCSTKRLPYCRLQLSMCSRLVVAFVNLSLVTKNTSEFSAAWSQPTCAQSVQREASEHHAPTETESWMFLSLCIPKPSPDVDADRCSRLWKYLKRPLSTRSILSEASWSAKMTSPCEKLTRETAVLQTSCMQAGLSKA